MLVKMNLLFLRIHFMLQSYNYILNSSFGDYLCCKKKYETFYEQMKYDEHWYLNLIKKCYY